MIKSDIVIKESVVFRSLWWVLWLSGVVLLRFFIRDINGIRLKLPDGYYLFYSIAAMSWAPLLLNTKFKKIQTVDWQFLAALLF